MNKWFKLALNSFLGIVLIQFIWAIFAGGGLLINPFFIAPLLVFVAKVLYITLVVGLIVGLFVTVKDYVA